MAKYRDYQEKTKRYKEIARGTRRLTAKRALDFGKSPASKRAKFTIPYRSPNIEGGREWVHVEQGTVAGKTLISYLLTDIPISGSDPDVAREKSTIFVKGINLRMGFKNLQGCPTFVNVAVIAGKKSMEGISTVPVTNFFRNDGSTASNNRYIDFSVAHSARQLHYLPINTEEWTVLHHSRYTLNTSGNGDLISSNANRGGGTNDWLEVDKYLPVNRRLTYDNGLGSSCTTPIWIAFWVSRWDQNQAATPVAATTETWLYATTNFKDTP